MEVLAEDPYLYRFQSGDALEVRLQIGVPIETEHGAGFCQSAVVGLQEFECTADDTFGALCGAIRLMKEWLFERYTKGDGLWSITDDTEADEDEGPFPFWLLFNCRSQMTEADKLKLEQMNTELEAELANLKSVVETEESVREHAAAKERARTIKRTPITHVAAAARYYSLHPNGSLTPSEIVLERPYLDDLGHPVIRIAVTHWNDPPFPMSGESLFSATIMTLRLAWFLLKDGCTHHGVKLFRDKDCLNPTDPASIFNDLFQPGD